MRVAIVLTLVGAIARPALAAERPAGRSAADRSRTGSHCLAKPVRILRAYTHPPETAELSLTHCDGRPHRAALDELSILARPDGVDRPSKQQRRRFRRTAPPARRRRFVAPDIMRLHAGLLKRLQTIANQWPDERIEIVSGYRPSARNTSRHHHGRALDIRVSDVHRRKVSRFARTLERTGVGFYPNSVFTHVDVRHQQAYWVDRSAPGEPADYGPWPPSGQEVDRVRERVLASVDDALAALRNGGGDHEPRSPGELVDAEEPAPTGTARATDTDAAGPPRGERDDDDAVGGVISASGVKAAWSTVPGEEEDAAGEGSNDAGSGSNEAPPASTRSQRQKAHRVEREAMAELDRLLGSGE